MTATSIVRVGTRGSALAMAQARIAVEALGAAVGATELVPIATRGDRRSRRSPRASWVEGDGQFTADLEVALLEGRIDVAVHSFKDLPTAPVDGLVVAAILERADARDCLITRDELRLDQLPRGARIGTSSPRRAAQLAAVRPDLVPVPMRGNVETRLCRVAGGELDGAVLAAAGLDRLGVRVPDAARLPYEVMLPAPAQGALAVQVRVADAALASAASSADHTATRVAVEAERALLRRIGGGCLAPLGALGTVGRDGLLVLRAAFADGSGELRRAEGQGHADDPEPVVAEVARRILGA